MEAAFNQHQVDPKCRASGGARLQNLSLLNFLTKILVALIYALRLQFYLPKGLTTSRSSRYNPRNLPEGKPLFHTCNVRYFVCIF